jgi:CBS domain-containing protein
MIRARDVMQASVLTVSPGMSLTELEDFLVSKRITGAPVVERGVLIGIVSRSDIVRLLSLERSLSGLIAEGLENPETAGTDSVRLPEPLTRALTGRTVRDAMVVDLVTVSPDTPVTEVARLLVARHIHRVLVTEGEKVRGVISTLDLVRLVAEDRLREA